MRAAHEARLKRLAEAIQDRQQRQTARRRSGSSAEWLEQYSHVIQETARRSRLSIHEVDQLQELLREINNRRTRR